MRGSLETIVGAMFAGKTSEIKTVESSLSAKYLF